MRMKRDKFAIPDSQLEPFGLAIKTRRLELNISQDELADQTKHHRTYISLIERKSYNVTIKIFLELAEALELTPTELLELMASIAAPKKKKS
jgi:transcriptional regulator with XRE-family HTH domain